MSRMMISPHERIDGVPTSKGSAGTNATRDALEADRQRNMPHGLRPRTDIDANDKARKQATEQWAGRRTLATGTVVPCAMCGRKIKRRNAKHKYCKPCAIEYDLANKRRLNAKRYRKG
jgi:hypothetical protein